VKKLLNAFAISTGSVITLPSTFSCSIELVIVFVDDVCCRMSPLLRALVLFELLLMNLSLAIIFGVLKVKVLRLADDHILLAVADLKDMLD
jgi:hypothetical protein